MEYIVSKGFRDMDDTFKKAGDTVEADDNRAAKLRRYGLIGASVTPKKQIETTSVDIKEVAEIYPESKIIQSKQEALEQAKKQSAKPKKGGESK